MTSQVRKSVVITVVSACVLALILWLPNRKTSAYKLHSAEKKENQVPIFGRKDTTTVSKTDFLTTLLREVKVPGYVMRYLESKSPSPDSAARVKKWAMETGTYALFASIQFEEAKASGSAEELLTASQFCADAASNSEGAVSSYLWQLVKSGAQAVLNSDKNHLRAKSILATYTSEFENQPMQAVAMLRENLAIDSNDIETHFIYLRLLKKSGQYQKALQKSLKLVSLQPQNPDFLFETSELYGLIGDKTNAQVYLNLGVKAQKKQETKK